MRYYFGDLKWAELPISADKCITPFEGAGPGSCGSKRNKGAVMVRIGLGVYCFIYSGAPK